jgi:hypothetical protein
MNFLQKMSNAVKVTRLVITLSCVDSEVEGFFKEINTCFPKLTVWFPNLQEVTVKNATIERSYARNLSVCQNITAEGFLALGRCKNLVELDLGHTHPDDTVVQALQDIR